MIKIIKIQGLAFLLGSFCFFCFISLHNSISEFMVSSGVSPYIIKVIGSAFQQEILRHVGVIIYLFIYDLLIFVSISIILVYFFSIKLHERWFLSSIVMTLGAFVADKIYFLVYYKCPYDFTYFQSLMLWSVDKHVSILIILIVMNMYFLLTIFLSSKIREKT